MQQKRSARDIFVEQNKDIIEETECLQEQFEDIAQKISDGKPAVLQKMDSPSIQPSQQVLMSGIQPPKAENLKSKSINMSQLKSSEELQLEKEPIRVKETGAWFWKRVIIPPNAYVVHTRINRKNPVTIGLGISFRYNPDTDAYLVVPAAMQTIGVVANCISKEKQGINILAYVQWQIADFAIAYKKLDFSDLRDPLGIVNAQLREQAEAAIKDKIATMSVEEVLTDKAPIIEELTSRLKVVAEGQGKEGASEGLGIKIATVQIREAYVSSKNLWEDLQSPFRHEQKKKANISLLEMEDQVKKKELESRKDRETNEVETNLLIEQLKQKKATEMIESKLNEEQIQFKKQQETLQNKFKLEEETLIKKKETDDNILKKENEIKLIREIETLKQIDKKAQEEARLNLDVRKRDMAFGTELNLFEIKEQAKKQLTNIETKLKIIEQEKILNDSESQFEILKQKYSEELEKTKIQAGIEREKLLKELELKFQEERNKLQLQYDEDNLKIEKIRQEIKNMINENVLVHSLIKELPQIAAGMPEIKELKIFQSDGNDGLTNNFIIFIQKIMSLIKDVDLSAAFKRHDDKKQGKQ